MKSIHRHLHDYVDGLRVYRVQAVKSYRFWAYRV